MCISEYDGGHNRVCHGCRVHDCDCGCHGGDGSDEVDDGRVCDDRRPVCLVILWRMLQRMLMIGLRCENYVWNTRSDQGGDPDHLDQSSDLDRSGQCCKCGVILHMDSLERRHDGTSVIDKGVCTFGGRVWLVHVDSPCWNENCIRRLLLSR